MRLNKLNFMFIFLMISMSLFAQEELTIKGSIIDENGEMLPGVTVSIKGTGTGTIADMDGNYTITVPSKETILVFSFIGYISYEHVAHKSQIDVVLKENVESLDELVVVGYGVQRKETVTGAISTVGNEALAAAPVSNLNSAITGKLPGVVTIQTSGRPGEDAATIFIRGRSTWIDASPLIIVDGIERSSFSQIDPNEVETISVLKDAASTAVYGVRGANGVILVTTKRGQQGKPRVSISANVGIQRPVNIPEFLGSYDHLVLRKVAAENDGIDLSTEPLLTDESLEGFRLGEDPYSYPDINWYQEMVKNYSMQQQYNMNISGGTKKVKYFTSIGYLDQGGMFKYTDTNPLYNSDTYYRRFNFRSNIDLEINKYQSGSINFSGRVQTKNGFPDVSNLMQTIIAKVPYNHPIYNPDGSIAVSPSKSNPLTKIAYSGYDNIRTNYYDIVGILRNDLSFLLKGLAFDMNISFNSAIGTCKSYREQAATYYYDPDDHSYTQQTTYTPFSYKGESTTTSYRKVGIQLFLKYNKAFGRSEIRSTFVYNQQNDQYYSKIPYVLMGYAARIEYDFDKKYLAEIDMAYNGSENFAPGHQFGFFPAASLGYVITQEPFMAKYKDIIPYLKIRGSIGLVGSDKVGSSRFLWQGMYATAGTSISTTQYFSFGTTSPTNSGGIYESRAENKDLTWETSLKENIGIEGHLFKDDLFRFSVDFFYEHREDILMSARSLSSVTGIPSPTYNIGEVKNQGYEIEVSHRNSYGDFGYALSGSYCFASNEILDYDDPAGTPSYQKYAGYRIGQFRGYNVLGFFEDEDDVANSPSQTTLGGPILPGDLKYEDVSEDGKINATDKTPIGYSSVPEITFALTPEISYKGLTLSVLFQGAANSSVFFTSNAGFEFGGAAGGGQVTKVHQDYWRTDNRDAKYPTLHLNAQHSNKNLNSFHLKSGNYLRIRNIKLNYNVPERYYKSIGLTSCNIFLSGSNVKTWSYIENFDPETVTTDGEVYPQQSVYNIGVNVTF